MKVMSLKHEPDLKQSHLYCYVSLCVWRVGIVDAILGIKPIPDMTDRGTSLIRNSPFLGSYSRPMPRALWWS